MGGGLRACYRGGVGVTVALVSTKISVATGCFEVKLKTSPLHGTAVPVKNFEEGLGIVLYVLYD